MKPIRTMGAEVQSEARVNSRLTRCVGLDAQFAELLETIWGCERQWTIDDHVDAAIKYGRK